jgi:hypothetical protein
MLSTSVHFYTIMESLDVKTRYSDHLLILPEIRVVRHNVGIPAAWATPHWLQTHAATNDTMFSNWY